MKQQREMDTRKARLIFEAVKSRHCAGDPPYASGVIWMAGLFLCDEVERMRSLLVAVSKVREHQEKPSIANQGQCLDGFSALVSYNSIADKIKLFLEEK